MITCAMNCEHQVDGLCALSTVSAVETVCTECAYYKAKNRKDNPCGNELLNTRFVGFTDGSDSDDIY